MAGAAQPSVVVAAGADDDNDDEKSVDSVRPAKGLDMGRIRNFGQAEVEVLPESLDDSLPQPSSALDGNARPPAMEAVVVFETEKLQKMTGVIRYQARRQHLQTSSSHRAACHV